MRRHTSARALTATVLSAALSLGVLAAPGYAADGDDTGTAQARIDAVRSSYAEARAASDGAAPAASSGTRTASSTRTASAAPDNCNSDASGDTVDRDTGQPTDEPRGDLLESCFSFGSSLALKLRVAEPTDPSTHPGWGNLTFASWLIDTDDDNSGDYYVDYLRDASGDIVATVYDLHEDPAAQTCVVGTDYVDGWYVVTAIEPSCIGGSVHASASAAMTWDDGEVYHFDLLGNGDFPADVRAGEKREKGRLAGATRIQTAVEISEYEFPQAGDANAVYLARQDVFADAVAGGVVRDGPILLVPSCGELPAVVGAEIDRLDPNYVVALGGVNAVCSEILTAAAKHVDSSGNAKKRIAGATRIETSVAISRTLFADTSRADVVYLARQDVFADAVAAGVLTDGPVLLVPTCGTVPSSVIDEVARLDPSRVLALGGPGAVCDQVLSDAAGSHPTGRVAGPTRYETAIAIANRAFPDGAVEAYLARADVLVDAVAGGVLTSGPILLVPSCGSMPGSVISEIRRLSPARVTALGGDAAVCQDMLNAGARA